MTRWALRVAAAAAVLLALYTAAGWFLAPRYVRGALEEQAAARGLELRIDAVRTHPFGFAVELEGVELLERGQRLAAAGTLSADLAWASLWRDGWIVQRLAAANGTLHLPGDVVLEQVRASAQGLSTAPGSEPAPYELSAAPASGGTLKSDGTLSLDPLLARGSLAAEALSLAKVWHLAAPGTQALPGSVGGTAAYAWEEGRLAFRDISLRAEPEAGGSAVASGSWNVAAGRATLRLEAQALPLAAAQPFLPDHVDARIASGRASTQGRLALGEGFAYSGALAVADLRLEERDSKRLLLAWKQARTAGLRLTNDALELGEIEAQAPEARLVIEQGGRFNFAEAFTGEDGNGGRSFRVAFKRLSISEGTLRFADRTLENPFETTIVALAGTVGGFSTEAGEPARVQLDGRIQPYGSARIRGTIDLDSPTSLADINARLRNLRLEAFNPYITRFAGYRIASGRVSATLRYELEDGRLVGRNDLVFEEMRLGEKVESSGAPDLPLELAAALLADDKGRITIDIPVRGNLRDPQFDFRAIISRAIGNTLRRLVTAPFRALAALVGGKGEDLGAIAFAPGRAELSPPAEEDVVRIAEALAARPRLEVAIHAGFDPERDLRALQLRAARDEIAARAGVDPRGPLDFTNAKVRRAAEQIFLRRGGSHEDLRALRGAEGDYGRALVRRIAQALPIGETSVDVLAQARGEAVRAALLERGVDPGRVRIDAARVEPAGEEGIATELALRARRSAAAGR